MEQVLPAYKALLEEIRSGIEDEAGPLSWRRPDFHGDLTRCDPGVNRKDIVSLAWWVPHVGQVDFDPLLDRFLDISGEHGFRSFDDTEIGTQRILGHPGRSRGEATIHLDTRDDFLGIELRTVCHTWSSGRPDTDSA